MLEMFFAILTAFPFERLLVRLRKELGVEEADRVGEEGSSRGESGGEAKVRARFPSGEAMGLGETQCVRT